MLENIINTIEDPILDLTEKFNNDPRKQKVNLGVGIYKNEFGDTPILSSVKKVEKYLLEHEITKNYLPISGIENFAHVIQKLLFGENNSILTENRIKTLQAIGGTGALRLTAEFITSKISTKRIWISNPTWLNHYNIFQSVGLIICQYDYFNKKTHELDFYGILKSLENAQSGDALLIHACCHNPTGLDLNLEQWHTLSSFVKEKKMLPIFDFAYQGFGQGLEEDSQGLCIFIKNNPEIIIASSYSKNFGLYNERVGALTIIADSKKQVENSFNQIKSIIRASYSNPPVHGASIVTTILSNPLLKKEWIKELTLMRQRIKSIRQLFVKTLYDEGTTQDFEFINKQNGMFSFSGLNNQQVMKLRDKYGIYIINSGRLNLAGLNTENIIPVCKAIIEVL